MNITVFGATGGVGRHLIPLALAEGHEVTAFTRNPTGVVRNHPDLDVVTGDVLDEAAVRRAVAGRDAVVCALGRPLSNGEGLRARGTEVIVRAMQAEGVRRLACLSALGTGESVAVLPRIYRWLLVPTVMRRLFADHGAQEELVRRSGLDWVLVRPGNFTDGERTSRYRHGFTRPERGLAFKVSRADVAEFLLRQLAEDNYLGRAAALSY